MYDVRDDASVSVWEGGACDRLLGYDDVCGVECGCALMTSAVVHATPTDSVEGMDTDGSVEGR